MKNTLQQVFRSPKFLVGFVIFMAILLTVLIYPLVITDPPLDIIGQGTFFEPGIYVNVLDTINAKPYIIALDDAAEKRIASKLNEQDKVDMRTWLMAVGVPETEIDLTNSETLIELWINTYDSTTKIPGMTSAKRNYYARLDKAIHTLLTSSGVSVVPLGAEIGTQEQVDTVTPTDYANVYQIANVRVLPLGTDNFGRDMLTELVSATGTSLRIGLIAGLIATFIGLTLGLLAGYVGGITDDIITFFTNLFIVIPGFVLLILISFSIGQEQRGAGTVAVVIGLTSWVWTAKAVRAQVFSLRNRDHVNLSKLSGHSLVRIILTDILPYIASYVVMALILQISSGIIAEAGLSILGLGPKTTEVPTLGLMMNWAMIYSAHVTGKWWAYMPVLVITALVTFSMNLMNTGLDQVFNPALRD